MIAEKPGSKVPIRLCVTENHDLLKPALVRSILPWPARCFIRNFLRISLLGSNCSEDELTTDNAVRNLGDQVLNCVVQQGVPKICGR